MTEGVARTPANIGARPSVACSRTRHLPLAGEDGRFTYPAKNAFTSCMNRSN